MYLLDYDLQKLLICLDREGFSAYKVSADTEIGYSYLCRVVKQGTSRDSEFGTIRKVVNYALDRIPLEKINQCVKGE